MAKKYELGELVYKITGDSAGLDKTITASNKKVDTLGSTLKKAAVGVAAFIAGGKLIDFFKESSKAASDAEETASKFGVVFSKIPEIANKAADELATAYGFTSTAAKKLLSDTGNLLQGFGLNQESALLLSDVVQKLSADLVSFSNFSGGVEGASKALTAALMGETEAAKSLGLALGDEQLKQFGLKMGLNTEKMSLQEKAFLRVKLAAEQSKNAIGDYAETQDSFSNTMRKVDTRIEEIKTSLGKELNPGLLQLAKSFLLASSSGGFLSDALGSIGRAVSTAITAVAKLMDWLGKLSATHKTNFGTYEIIEASKQLQKYKQETVDLLQKMGDKSVTAATGADVLINKLVALSKTNNSFDVQRLMVGFDNTFKRLKIANEGYDEGTQSLKAYADAAKIAAKTKDEENASRQKGIDALGKEIDKSEKAQGRLAKLAEPPDLSNIEKAKQKAVEYLQEIGNVSITAKSSMEDVGEALRDIAPKDSKAADLLQSMRSAGLKLKETFSELSIEDQAKAVLSGFNDILSGATGLMQAMQNLESARLQHSLAVLDAQMNAELEAAGVREETAVETAQKEYDAALATGDAATQAEKKKALDRAKIEEKYAKEKEKREFESAVRGWELQLAMAKIQMLQAPLNAFTSSLTAPWPLNMILAPINAAIAFATAMKNYQAVQAAKPVASFAEGGIVPGSSYTGDKVPVQANSGELIANTEQQGRLMDILNGKGSAGATTLYKVAPLEKQSFFDEIFRASQNGQLLIADRAVVVS